MKDRQVYVDMMRGIAILLVVAAHLIQTNVEDGIHNQAFMFINLFHMPLFFMISGYIGWKVAIPMGADSFLRFVKKKILRLGLPLFVWTIVVNYFFFTDIWRIPPSEVFVGIVVQPGLWFLLTLLQIYIVFGVFLLLNTKFNDCNSIWIDLCILLCVGTLTGIYGLWIPSLNSLFLYTLFFYFGVMLSKHREFSQIAFNEWIFVIAFFVFCILSCHWDMHSGSMIDDLLKVILAPCAFIILMNVCKKYEKIGLAKYMSLWGRYSLEVYVVHWALLLFVQNTHIALIGLNSFWMLVLSCVIALPIVYISILFSKMVEVSPKLRLLLFGRKK